MRQFLALRIKHFRMRSLPPFPSVTVSVNSSFPVELSLPYRRRHRESTDPWLNNQLSFPGCLLS